MRNPDKIALKIVAHVDGLLAYWDRNERCRFANAAYQTWFGKTPQQVIGHTLRDLLGPLYESNRPEIDAALRGEVQIFEREYQMPDGSLRQCLASYYPDIVDGEVAGFCVQVTDVTRLKELERQLTQAKLDAENLATHDFLTGLPNRVLLKDTIDAALHRARRSGGFSGVASIDIDSFKTINDTYGHEVGDHVLVEIATRLRSVLRATDTVLRLGGDEFIVVISDLQTREHLHQAFVRLIESAIHPIREGEHHLQPSFSCGVAVFPGGGSTVEDLLRCADACMYEAKRAGKDRIVFSR